MGTCSSKAPPQPTDSNCTDNNTKANEQSAAQPPVLSTSQGSHAADAAPNAATAAADGNLAIHVPSAVSNAPDGAIVVDTTGTEPQLHKFDSLKSPNRSAMRASESSRRRSAELPGVGFIVGSDAPDEEHPHVLTEASSISLKKIIDTFYNKVLADSVLLSYFEGVDMAKLKRHQARFMGLAFGGKELVFEEDPNLNLRKVHYHLIRDKGLNVSHWEQFVHLFDQTMNEFEREIPLETRQTASTRVRATRDYFVPIGQETTYTNASIAALPEADAPAV